MSYKLQLPNNQKTDFIVEYNHKQGLLIQFGTDTYKSDEYVFKGDFIFALEVNEIMADVEVEIDVPTFHTVEKEIINPETGEAEIIEVEEPVMIEVEETITVIDYDEEGNPIGEHKETITKLVQDYHKETTTVNKPVVNPNYEQEQAEKRETEFNKAFFNTSLGYIRRAVTMADGSKKDFLSDLMPTIKMRLESGIPVNILAYDKPPFDHDIEDWTEYQHKVVVTPQFIQECFMQLGNDFLPINED